LKKENKGLKEKLKKDSKKKKLLSEQKENVLVSYYEVEYIRFHLKKFNVLRIFSAHSVKRGILVKSTWRATFKEGIVQTLVLLSPPEKCFRN